MFWSFNTLEDLFAHIKEDKEWTGANAAHHNRYPVRFVLFDNFADFNQFINDRPDGIYMRSIDKMLDSNSPDEFLSYTELSKEIRAFVKKIPANDFVIFPFSEIARFYTHKEFDSLVSTIRSQEAPQDAQNKHIRLYIPIVGMQSKMGRFIEDKTTFVWEFKSEATKGTYTLVISNGTTYDVKGLEEKYSVVANLSEWLKLWEKGDSVKKTIICSSPNIFGNAYLAQPDNAFTYLECKNAHQFLSQGIQLDLGTTTEPPADEMTYWEQLAREIDVTEFNFDSFVKKRLDTFSLRNGLDFIKSWFNCTTDFDRWLLALYFRKVSNGEGYIYQSVSHSASLSKSELFSNIATLIFEDTSNDAAIAERKEAMILAANHGVRITDLAKAKLKEKLSAIATSQELGGYSMAIKLLTPLTSEELKLAIEWISKEKIGVTCVKAIFPGLYYYLEPLSLNSLNSTTQWISDYFDAYRQSKIADCISSEVNSTISDKNANTAAFYRWFNNFKTVKTILHNRQDIDVFYWIDGLGVDWIPLIRHVISRYAKENVYLNEVYVASATLPTVTSVNKEKLISILPKDKTLPKIEDIDSFAHSNKSYPQYIIDEIAKVEKSISKVLEEYNGQKIAFVSDHGLTYLSQLKPGLKIGGLKSDHEGRLASYTGSIVDDNNYVKLDDGKTICSLTHHSLIDKVDKGHGAHGGCTPEEVLVPIIIVSSHKNAHTYSVSIENDEINGTNPILRFIIKGLTTIDIPSIEYNGVVYRLFANGNNIFESERLNLVDSATTVKVFINNEPFDSFNIKVSTGATEDDLFDF